MKNILALISILFIIGCNDQKNTSDFDFKSAVSHLQEEIEELEGSPQKNTLLWKVNKILAEDTLFKYNLRANEYDSLKSAIIWNENFKIPMKQIELNDIEEIEFGDSIEAYKFMCMRAFSAETIMITISKQEEGLSLIESQVFWQDRDCNPIVGSRKLDGSCFKVKLNVTRQISDNVWRGFVNLVEELSFWELERESNKDDIILDGSEWTIEATRSNNDTTNLEKQSYRKVFRRSPDQNSSMYALGSYLLNQTKYDWGAIY